MEKVLVLWIVFVFMISTSCVFCFFFFNDTATTEIYTLSLHDALPISLCALEIFLLKVSAARIHGHPAARAGSSSLTDRKSTRLNSSHSQISYAVFCLKKKNNTILLI